MTSFKDEHTETVTHDKSSSSEANIATAAYDRFTGGVDVTINCSRLFNVSSSSSLSEEYNVENPFDEQDAVSSQHFTIFFCFIGASVTDGAIANFGHLDTVCPFKKQYRHSIAKRVGQMIRLLGSRVSRTK